MTEQSYANADVISEAVVKLKSFSAPTSLRFIIGPHANITVAPCPSGLLRTAAATAVLILVVMCRLAASHICEAQVQMARLLGGNLVDLRPYWHNNFKLFDTNTMKLLGCLALSAVGFV